MATKVFYLWIKQKLANLRHNVPSNYFCFGYIIRCFANHEMNETSLNIHGNIHDLSTLVLEDYQKDKMWSVYYCLINHIWLFLLLLI